MSRPWMVLAVDTTETRGVDVRVDLGRADVGMSEKLLNGADIRTVGKHVRGEAVAKHVRRGTGGVRSGRTAHPSPDP